MLSIGVVNSRDLIATWPLPTVEISPGTTSISPPSSRWAAAFHVPRPNVLVGCKALELLMAKRIEIKVNTIPSDGL